MKLKIPKGARAVATIGEWTLYELAPRPEASPLWCPFRVMLPAGTPRKWGERHAFDISWNPLELRMRKDAHRRDLELRFPDLYERVELVLSLEYGPEWLKRVGGLTDEEILAEKARLSAYASERRAAKRRAASSAGGG